MSGSNAGETRDCWTAIVGQFKTQDAPDRPALNFDPTTGWVEMHHPTDFFPNDWSRYIIDSWGKFIGVGGNSNHTAKWYFALSALYQFSRYGNHDTHVQLPRAKYTLRFRRRFPEGRNIVSPDFITDPVPDRILNRIFLGTVTEQIKTPLAMPRHAILVLRYAASTFGTATPNFTVRCRRRRVLVPEAGATIDSETGLPSPAAWKWTRNPVWCACDYITDEVFGGGQFYGWTETMLQSALEAAAWCDEQVAVARGSLETETRAELDLTLREKRALHDHVQQMLSAALVIPVQVGGTWKFVPDRDESPVMDLTDQDFEGGTTVPSKASFEEIANELDVLVQLEADRGELTTLPVRLDGDNAAARIIRPLDFTGARRETQVRRAATQILEQARLSRFQFDVFDARLRLAQLEAGDIVRVTSTRQKLTSALYRVVRAGMGANRKVACTLAEHVPAAYGVLPNVTAPVSGPPKSEGVGPPRTDDGTGGGFEGGGTINFGGLVATVEL